MFGFFKKKEKLLDQQISKDKKSAKVVKVDAQGSNQPTLKTDKQTLVEPDPLEKEKQDFHIKLEAKEKELATSQSASKTAKEEAQAAQKSLAETKAKLEAKEKELATSQSASKTAKEEAQAAQKSLAETKAKLEAKEKEIEKVKLSAQDHTQENELILMQLMQTQEELVEYFEQRGEFEKLYQTYKSRCERIVKRMPQYSDFGELKITKVDGVSDTQSVFWRVRDLVGDGIESSDFDFVINLKEGHPGIGLVIDGLEQSFTPKLLGVDQKQAGIFLSLGTKQFRMMLSVAAIFDQLESSGWQGLELAPDFDLGFWRPYMKSLVTQIKQLPLILRYDQIKLKRELINPDYEHLWLEFYGLNFGANYWNKFEIRLGAALIEENGFSQYPKFEIPLIDGKTKPFDSWFEESKDDSGPKLELRFSLEKKVFDIAVWTRLSDVDKALMLRLIYAMPNALRALSDQKAMLYRPLDSWIDFATKAVKVMEANRQAKKVADQEAGNAATQSNVNVAKNISPAISREIQANTLSNSQIAIPGRSNQSPQNVKVINVSSGSIAKGRAQLGSNSNSGSQSVATKKSNNSRKASPKRGVKS